jgi:hypothetical protein
MKKKIKVGFVPLAFASKEDEKGFKDALNYEKGILPNQPEPEREKQEESSESQPQTLWIDEAVKYLGLDRTGLKAPERAIHRLISKGALHPKKISGRLVFDRDELDRVLAEGDHKKGRGRPRK